MQFCDKIISQTVPGDDCVVYGSGDWRNYHTDCLQQNGNDDVCLCVPGVIIMLF